MKVFEQLIVICQTAHGDINELTQITQKGKFIGYIWIYENQIRHHFHGHTVAISSKIFIIASYSAIKLQNLHYSLQAAFSKLIGGLIKYYGSWKLNRIPPGGV